MNKRNYSIDLLRFIASSWVVLFHLNEPILYVNNAYRNFAKLGWLGVPIFFVVSGYCIGLAAKHSKNAHDFGSRRFFRIFPAYWFSLLVVIICIALYALMNGQNSVATLPKTPKTFLATLFLLTSPLSTIKTINWVYWSLTVEIFFYIVIGLSLLVKVRYRFLFLLFVSVLAFIPGITNLPGLFFLQQWPSFGIGIALYEFQVNRNKWLEPVSLLAVNVLNLLACPHPYLYPTVSIICLAIIAISTFWKDLPDNRISQFGDYSYAVYLLHVPVGIYLFGNLKTVTIQSNIFLNIVYDLAALTVMILISSQVFKYIETPGIKFGKNLVKRKTPIENTLMVSN